jgi:predicted enzyme related to lactoylglutathione lyase
MNISQAFEGAYGSMYYVNDMAKSVQYYKDMFNLAPAMESPEWTEFNLNGHTLCLHALEPGKKSDGKAILITKVKGLEAVVAELKNRGVEFMNEIHQVCEGGFSADFRDPSGNQISLFEYKG